jgi:hypothetical protein
MQEEQSPHKEGSSHDAPHNNKSRDFTFGAEANKYLFSSVKATGVEKPDRDCARGLSSFPESKMC